MWFTEDAWSPIIVCVVIGAIFFIAYLQTRRKKLLYGVALSLVLIITLFFVEKTIQTDQEQVNERLAELITTLSEESQSAKRGVRPQNIRCYDFFTEDNVTDRALIAYGITGYSISEVRMPSIETTMSSDNKTATTDFRANGTYGTNRSGGHFSTRWEVVWEKVGGDWKINETRMKDPVSGKSIAMPR